MSDMSPEEREAIRVRLFGEDGKQFDPEMLDIEARRGFFESEAEEMEKALELTAAGWSAEITDAHTPHPFKGSVAVMSWFWRRPSRRPGKPGKLYRSTNQAFRAYKRGE